MKKLVISVFLITFFINLPYMVAALSQDEIHYFGGFIFNPIDGNSYLSKMQIGMEGEWKFKLLYSPPGGNGGYLFLFYIGLGHISRLLSVPPIWIFHGARVSASIFLLFSLYKLCIWIMNDDRAAFWAWLLAATGSGFGWAVFLWIGMTADFWVAEAYPWLSMVSSPHFSFGLAIMCYVLPIIFSSPTTLKFVILIVCGLLIAVVMPFLIFVMSIVLLIVLVMNIYEKKEIKKAPLYVFFIPAYILVGYQYYVISTDQMLVLWNAQNITEAPQIWDFLLSFSPALMISIVWIFQNIRHEQCFPVRLVLVWLLAGAVLVYLPFSLQRRFMVGYYIPVAISAIIFLEQKRFSKLITPGLVGVSLLTNLILSAIIISGIISKHEEYFIQANIIKYIRCIGDETRYGDVILAPNEINQLIPAHAGRHVITGHPMESINSSQMKKIVNDYYQGKIELREVEIACDCAFDYIVLPSDKLRLFIDAERKGSTYCHTESYFLMSVKNE